MADNKVKFLRGTSAEYKASPKDKDTFYYTTDDEKLYLGNKEIAAAAATAAANAQTTAENAATAASEAKSAASAAQTTAESAATAASEAKSAASAAQTASKPVSFSVATSKWTSSTAYTGYNYYADVTVSGMTTSDSVDVRFSMSSMSVCTTAEIAGACVTNSGSFRLYAKSKPTETVSGVYLVQKGE